MNEKNLVYGYRAGWGAKVNYDMEKPYEQG